MPAPLSITLLAGAALLVAPSCGEGSGAEEREARADSGAATAEAPALAPQAAADEWPLSRGDQGLRGVAGGVLPEHLGLVWSTNVGRSIVSSPAVAGGAVYFGADDQALHCLDAETGEARWAFPTGDMIEAPPLVIDGAVFIGSGDFFFYCVDAATGELRWKYEVDDRIPGGANYHRASDGLRIVFGCYDSRLYCLDAVTGELRWVYATDNYVNATPAVGDGHAVFGGCDAILHVVDIETGEAASRVELGAGCHVAGSVALDDGRAYLGHYGNRFLAVELATGTIEWEFGDREAFFSSPAILADRIVFGGRDRKLHCVRRADGTPIWEFATRRRVDASPTVVGDDVVLAADDGRLWRLALADGAVRWSYDVGHGLVASPAVVAGRIYVGATDGVLYAFGEVPEEVSADDAPDDAQVEDPDEDDAK